MLPIRPLNTSGALHALTLLRSMIQPTLRNPPPFVLTRRNAVAYFNPSSEIKFTDKRTVRGKLRLPKYQRGFRTFLVQNVDPKYTRFD